MDTATVEGVIARLARARDEARGRACVAFDGDGTLWSGDVGEDLFFALVGDDAIHPAAHDALRTHAAARGVPTDGTASELALRVFAAYEAGAFPEDLLYEATAWLCAGWRRADVSAYARAVLDREAGFAGRVHEEARACLEWARREGVRVLVVSASPQPVVEEAAGRLGVRPEDVVALAPRWSVDGVMRADVERPIPYGPGKVSGLEARAGDLVLCGAFGDNAFDAPLLRAARVPVAVRPKERLRAIAAEVPGLVELVLGSAALV